MPHITHYIPSVSSYITIVFAIRLHRLVALTSSVCPPYKTATSRAASPRPGTATAPAAEDEELLLLLLLAVAVELELELESSLVDEASEPVADVAVEVPVEVKDTVERVVEAEEAADPEVLSVADALVAVLAAVIPRTEPYSDNKEACTEAAEDCRDAYMEFLSAPVAVTVLSAEASADSALAWAEE